MGKRFKKNAIFYGIMGLLIGVSTFVGGYANGALDQMDQDNEVFKGISDSLNDIIEEAETKKEED